MNEKLGQIKLKMTLAIIWLSAFSSFAYGNANSQFLDRAKEPLCGPKLRDKCVATLLADIQGIWKLKEFYRITEDDKRIEWCDGVHGYLNYTNQKLLFADINCSSTSSPSSPAAKYNFMIQYAAFYSFDANTNGLNHMVQNCSKVDLIGKNLVRYLEGVDQDHLYLWVPSDQNSVTHLVWERVRQ